MVQPDRDIGRGGARRTLVLLPGLLCDGTVWSAQAAALSGITDIIAFPDFHGHDSIAGMAEAVLAAAPARFALAGHSMGGRVALEIVRRAPERVGALALLDTGVHPRRPGEAEARQALVDLAWNEGMTALARRWLPPMLHPDRVGDAALMERLTAMVCRATPAVFEGQVRALLDRPDATMGLGAIRCPTLVLCGRQDGWSPPAQHEAMAAAIRGASLRIVEDCGHMATVERPEAVTDALRDWLDGVKA